MTEADRKRLDPDTPPARRKIVTEFMHEDEHAEDDDECSRAANEIRYKTQHGVGFRVRGVKRLRLASGYSLRGVRYRRGR